MQLKKLVQLRAGNRAGKYVGIRIVYLTFLEFGNGEETSSVNVGILDERTSRIFGAEREEVTNDSS